MVKGTKAEVRPGVWRLRVVTGYSPEGRPRQASRTFNGTKTQADTALSAFVTEVESGTANLDGATTLNQFLDRWLAHIEDQRSPTTIRGYRDKLRRVRRDLGSVHVAKLTGQVLDRTYRRWLDEGTSPATVHGIHRVLSVALHQAVKWGMVQRAATELATPPGRPARSVAALDPDVVIRIIFEARDSDPVLSAAVVIAATTGIRRGELCGLRWSDLDYESGRLYVRRAVKYGLSRQIEVGPTKTHQERRLALDSGTLEVLADHRDKVEHWAADARVALGPDGYMFTLDPSGTTPWLPDSFGQAFQRIAARIGAHVRLQDLRHFNATHAIAAGIDVRTVAGRLGHADPCVTLKVYSSFVSDRDLVAAEAVGTLIRPALSRGQ